jgi:hypothetical protein
LIKAIVLVSLVVLGSTTSATAFDLSKPQGKDAAILADALRMAGSHTSCDNKTCSTLVTGISCGRGNSITAYCSLNVQTHFGKRADKHVTGYKASLLIDALYNSGFIGCGLEACGGGARTVTCSFPASLWVTVAQMQCSIE